MIQYDFGGIYAIQTTEERKVCIEVRKCVVEVGGLQT